MMSILVLSAGWIANTQRSIIVRRQAIITKSIIMSEEQEGCDVMTSSKEMTAIKTLLKRLKMRIEALEYASRNTDYPDKVIERLEDVENEIKQLKVR